MSDYSSLGPWLRRFLLEYLVGERNLAVNTRSSYRDMLVQLIAYAAGQLNKPADSLEVVDLSPGLLRRFLLYLEEERHCAVATRNQRLGGLHALAQFIGENSPEHLEWCAQVRLIPFKKTSHPNITYLDKPELDALLAAPERSTKQGRRDYALLLFLYNSGTRASEAAGVRVADVDWDRRSVKILGKGNKQRICPLWPTTMEQLRILAGQRAADQHLFINRNGQPITRFGIHTFGRTLCRESFCARPIHQGEEGQPARGSAHHGNSPAASWRRHQYHSSMAGARFTQHDKYLCRN